MVLRSPYPVGSYARAVGDWLVEWAEKAPERTFLAERTGEAWRRLKYRDALSDVRRIGQALLDLGLGASRPVAILSDNGIDHALLSLGAMHVGVPVAPISPAYSLMSKDFGKLKYIFELLKPGLVYAADGERFAPALRAVPRGDAKLVFSARAPADLPSIAFSKLLDTTPGARLEVEFSRIKPETVAKILFTSGSTGMPKGVVNTQRMLCSNQQMYGQLWLFVEDRPPVLVDWLPWNHTFGGNNNFGMVLRNGGTLYIDAGKPVPGLVETSAKNLKEISSTIYFNVPRGFDLLMPFLEKDAELRRNFFRELEVVCYAGAALPQNLWERFEKLAVMEGRKPAMISAWGATETSPGVTAVHWPIERAGVIGLPAPGCELKLVPAGAKLEARVRGINVTPGYYGREDLTRLAFDDEGFYKIGDALKFADPDDPVKGLVFDGRVVEDFKLSSGTWVHVGAMRVKLIAACDPLLQDAVIAGHDREELGALVFLNPAVAKDLSPEQVRARLAEGLRKLAAESTGGSTRVARVLVASEPPSIDANEITDKGYINQRAVLERRAALVDRLYAEPLPADLITV